VALDKPTPDQNGDDTDDTLRADLEAAIAGATEAVDAADASETTQPAPGAAQIAPEGAPGPARGPDGKFAKADGAVVRPDGAPLTQPPAVAVVEPPVADAGPVRPPPGWSVESKAAFEALPPSVKADIAKREAEVSAGFRQYSEKVKAFEGFEDIMRQPDPRGTPWGDRLRAAGETPVNAIARLLNAQAALERDPVKAIAWLAQDYGVDLRRFGQGQTAQQPVMGADGKPAPQHLQRLLQGMIEQALQPALQPVLQKVQTFEQGWQSREQQERQAKEAALSAEIEAFASDPKHIYFDNVQPLMVQLINSGAAKGLDEAYQMAVYAHPETRQRLISEQQAAILRQQQADTQRVVNGAKRAAGSITGAPGNPADAGAPGAPPDDLRGAIEHAFSLHGGRA
jgi:hypothetical protein